MLAATSAVADELFARALETDAADVLPVANLDALAEAGLYGLVAPRSIGGLGAAPPLVHRVVEILAGGCMTTTFVWQQHLGALRAAAATPLGPQLAAGTRRGGVAFAHLRRPGSPAVTARTDGSGGWVLNGAAPWVTGWDRIDVVHTAAIDADDPTRIVWLLVDAVRSVSLVPERLRLAAVDASSTVRLRFDEHHVGADRVTSVEPLAEWQARDALGLRANGSLALGLVGRVGRLLGEAAGDLPGAVDAARALLDAATDLPSMAHARAHSSILAVQAAQALVAREGGSAIMRTNHAQRIMREAMFVTVQGQTAAIRAAQVGLLI